MGDMADFALEQTETMEELRLDYEMGRIDTVEAYEIGIVDEQGAYMRSSYRQKKTKTCRCCGETNLYWGNIRGKWRLVKNGELHNCPVNPLR